MWVSEEESMRRLEFFCPAEGRNQDQQTETVENDSAFLMEPAVKKRRINTHCEPAKRHDANRILKNGKRNRDRDQENLGPRLSQIK